MLSSFSNQKIYNQRLSCTQNVSLDGALEFLYRTMPQLLILPLQLMAAFFQQLIALNRHLFKDAMSAVATKEESGL